MVNVVLRNRFGCILDQNLVDLDMVNTVIRMYIKNGLDVGDSITVEEVGECL